MTFQMQNDIFDGVKKEPPCHIAFRYGLGGLIVWYVHLRDKSLNGYLYLLNFKK